MNNFQKHIGLFFGSFNPVHNAHLGLASYFVDNQFVDEVWFVISPQSPFKNDNLLSADERLVMLELAVADKPYLKTCDIELHLPTPSFTVNTLSALKQQYPDIQFTVILGSDQLQRFSDWKGWKTIAENFNIFFYPRPGFLFPVANQNNYPSDCIDITSSSTNGTISPVYDDNILSFPNVKIFHQAPLYDISATNIRKRILDNLPIDSFVPQAVNNYIEDHQLYRPQSDDNVTQQKSGYISKLLIVFLLCILPFTAFTQFYNGSQMEFGQRKIQYGNFIWSYYQFDTYDIYFYQNGQNLALDAKKVVDENLAGIQKNFNIRINDKLRVIIYNTLSDFNQTNLGALSKTSYNTGGIAYIIGNKVFVYFNGDITDFENQIKAGLYKVVMNETMKNSKLATMISNSDETNDWFVDGLAAYCAEGWDTYKDNEFRNLILSGKIKKLKSVSSHDAVLVGQSVWKYIEDFYGKNVPFDIFNTAILLSNPYDSFERILGMSFKEMDKAWKDYYTRLYNDYPPDNTDDGKIIISNKKNKVLNLNNLRYSPNGKYVTYTTNDNGLKKLFILDLQTGKKMRVYKTGFRSYNKIDETFPVVAWHPNSVTLAVATEEKGGSKIFFYDVSTGNLFFPSSIALSSLSFQKITDIAYSPDAKYIIMSAVRNGQSDIYIWNIVSGVSKQLTNDIYNDFNPRFIDNQGNIVFSSNRYCDNNQLKPSNDLYKLNVNSPQDIIRLSNSNNSNEIKPRSCRNGKISYISDENGIYNLYIAQFDSIISFVDTTTHYNYFIKTQNVTDNNSNIIDYDIVGDRFIGVYTVDKKSYVAEKQIPSLINNDKISQSKDNKLNFTYQKRLEIAKDSVKVLQSKLPKKKTLSFFDVKDKDLRAEIPTRDIILKIEPDNDTINITRSISNEYDDTKDIETDKWKPYRPEFFINTLITQIDFTSMSNSYQQFTGGSSPVYLYKGFNVLAGVGITDLMEDYRISGAFSLGTDLINNEYALSFSNLKHRLDKEFIFHRFTNISYLDYYGYNTQKQRTHEFIYKLTWPFTQFLHLSGSVIVKNNKIINTNITDITSIAKADKKSNWAGFVGELVFDNSFKVCQNNLLGTRFKVFGEYNQLIVKDNRNMVVLGFDFRNYQRIHRELIFAWRIAGSSSFGSDRLVYYMGGVDNWILPEYYYGNQVSQEMNYAYQTLATNMRGFPQNIRNGPNFIVLNTEIRFPFVRYIAQKPLRSKFLNSLQVIGFCDAGTAWNGWNPYSEENALFKKSYDKTPMHIEVNEHRNPYVVGYGIGARASLLGYFIRFDYGWGLEDGVISHKVFNVSLSLDF